MASKLALTEDDYLNIEKKCEIKDTEVYAVTYTRLRTKMVRTIHVFERKPDTREMAKYENESSKLVMRGKRTEIEGGAISASASLYKTLIHRVYDVIDGRRIVEGPLAKTEATALVDPLAKRAALRDLLGEVYSASQIAAEDDDAEKEGHTVDKD